MRNGIDVSKHQGNINWGHVDTDFAIIRAGYGKEISQKDIQFENNYAGCKSNNIPVGAYWYSYAKTAAEAKQEANVCLQVIKGKTFEYPIYFDLEEPDVLKLGKVRCTAIAKAFLEVVEKAGYWVGLYMSSSFLNSVIDDSVKTRYAIWVAHYGVSKPSYSGAYGIWQYGSNGAINGISGNVDTNHGYVDYPTAIKAKGLNGFGKSTSTASAATASKPVAVTPTADHGVASCSRIGAGYKIQLDKMHLFVSSDATKRANTLTGFYYVTDGKIINGRFRISARQGGTVTGWIDKKYTNETG